MDRDGRELIEEIEKVGWGIMNGYTKKDERGEFTYTGGRGESVIDYVIGEERIKGRVIRLEVGDNVESDHHPLVVTIERRGEGGEMRTKRRKEREG